MVGHFAHRRLFSTDFISIFFPLHQCLLHNVRQVELHFKLLILHEELLDPPVFTVNSILTVIICIGNCCWYHGLLWGLRVIADENLPVVFVREVGSGVLKCWLCASFDICMWAQMFLCFSCWPIESADPVPLETWFVFFFLLWCPTQCFPLVYVNMNDGKLILEDR